MFADAAGDLRGTVTHATLSAVLDQYRNSGWTADLVAMTGDVVQDDSRAAYQQFSRLLGSLELPVYCIPGNHDVRTIMQDELSAPPFFYCDETSFGNWLMIGIDSCVDDDAGGRISAVEMSRLADALRSTDADHIVVCLHHPPMPMQSKWLDQVGLKNDKAFLDLISSSNKVRLVLFGHVHQEFKATYKGIEIIGTPSTCRQFKPHCDEFTLDDKPPAYRQVELFDDGSVQTELKPVERNA